MKRLRRRLIGLGLILAMVLTMNGIPNAASAAAKPKLSTKKVTVKVGKSKKVTVKNAPKGSKVTWTSKNVKIAKVNKSGKITGVKKGSTTVTAKVVYKVNKKKKTTKLNVKVMVQEAAVQPTAAPTQNPTDMPTQNPTDVPTDMPTQNPTDIPTQNPTDAPVPDDGTDVSNLTAEHKSANGITTKDNGQMRENLTAAQLMKFMGQGWNLGNTLESCGKDLPASYQPTDYETFWGQPVTTQKMIDGIHSYGVNTVRIPVAWSNMISNDGKYTINDAYFNRVEEVINYVLNNEMYAIVNIHYDGDWWGQFGDADEKVREQAWAKYESFWNQIANRYKEYSDRLIFESANEELGERLNDNWATQNGKSGVLTTEEQYKVTNEINQKFVEIVRGTGGNNTYRHLLIAGFDTDVDKTCDSRYVMPKDTVTENGTAKLSVSVHYYSPSIYCIATSATNSWGFTDTWGTDADVKEMHDTLDKLKKFTKEGYGVIIGEYGPQSSSKDGVPKFIEEVMTYGAKSGFVPVIWEVGAFYNKATGEMKFKDVAEVFNKVTGANGVIPANAGMTGIQKAEDVSEEDLKKLYTWEGSWTRTDGSSVGGYEAKSCDEGLNVQPNSAFWQLWVNTDWSAVKSPYIKIYMASDELSQNADIQMAYTTAADGNPWVGDINLQTDWVEKCLPLDASWLKDNPWLMLSSNKPGATIVKIEIFDKK